MTLALLVAAVAPFSHGLHLKMVPDCAVCHPKAAASASVSESLLPAKAACARCHQDRIPEYRHLENPARQGPAPLARFPHALHVKTKTCRDCHAEGAPAKMAGCIVCHNQVSPPDSCAFCHTAGAKLRPASHTPDWVDVHSSGRLKFAKAECAVCHGTNFTCQGCH